VLVEAAAAGLPLIASRHAGATWDLVSDEETGYVVEPSDPASFASTMVRLARDPALRARLGDAARDRTRDRTPQHAAAGIRAAIGAALDRR
jgi:glycosyltransferase involved in cell wall biosynthesis